MRLYATKHMHVLLRSKMPFFNSWGLEMLIYQVRYIQQSSHEGSDQHCYNNNRLYSPLATGGNSIYLISTMLIQVLCTKVHCVHVHVALLYFAICEYDLYWRMDLVTLLLLS